MKQAIIKPLVAIFLVATAVSCAQKAINTQIDSKLSQETNIKTDSDLRNESEQLITNANLTESQKSQLLEVRKNWNEKNAAAKEESLKLRSLLLKDLMDPNYNRQEVSALQNRIKKNEGGRLALLVESVKKTNKILGREPTDAQRRKMINDTFEFGGARSLE